MKFTLEERPSDSSFVERVWRSHSERTGTFLSQAKSCWEIVVTKHEGQTMLTVRGPETKATPMDVQWTEGEFVASTFGWGPFCPICRQDKLWISEIPTCLRRVAPPSGCVARRGHIP